MDEQEAVRSNHFVSSAVIVFSLTFILSAFSFLFFVAEAMQNQSLEQGLAVSPYYGWTQEGLFVLFLFVFYLIGRRTDFERRCFQIAGIGFLAALIGQLLDAGAALSTTAPLGGGGRVIGIIFPFQGGIGSIVQAVVISAWIAAVPIAGLALAYLLNSEYPRALAETDGKDAKSWRAMFAMAFALITLSYIVSGVVDLLGSRIPQTDQFAFLRTIFVTYPPYDAYAADIVYPLLFFLGFYFFGRRLDTSKKGLATFATVAFAAAALGALVGIPLASEVRMLGASPGYPLPPLGLGLHFFAGLVEVGLNLVFLGLAAASLGFVRNWTAPSNSDKSVAIGLVGVAILLLMISIFLNILGASFGSTGIVTTVATATTTGH